MTSENAPSDFEEDLAAIGRCQAACARIRGELGKVIVGQEKVIEQVLVALLSRGHALMEGPPGLGKTLLVSSLAETTGLSFQWIQFTPDLMPGDATGVEIIREDFQSGQRGYEFLRGPLFANLILADEIHRAPAKTQAIVLEAMRERRVSTGGALHRLPDPYFILATQNPLEREGTPALLGAQLDRFLLSIRIDYPGDREEWELVRQVTTGRQGRIEPVVCGEELMAMQELVKRLPVSDHVLGYAWALARASRPGQKEAAEFVDRWVQWGAGPRGAIALVTGAKARAILHGRAEATVGDVQAMAKPGLRHRIVGNRAAEANAVSSDTLVEMLMEAVPPEATYVEPPAQGQTW